MMYEIIRRALGLRHVVKRVRWRRDLPVPMADGSVLLADHAIPVGVDNAPLLLVRSPYGRRSLIGQLYGRYFAHHGFQVIVQSCRGTAGSGGQFNEPFQHELEDGGDTITWLRRQPFYPGRFATVGGSYLGYTQLALPEHSKAELIGVVLQVAVTRASDIVWSDGALALEAPMGWATQNARGSDRTFANLIRVRRDMRAIRMAGMRGPLLTSYREASGQPAAFLEDWWSHAADDPWWARQDQSAALDQIDCPVLVQAGWYDLLLEAGIAQYRRLAERLPNVRLTIGPWTHASFGLKGAPIVMTEAADFLHAAFAGTPLAGKPVRLLDARGGAEERLEAWPPASVLETLFLSAGAISSKAPRSDVVFTPFRYDPENPTPSIGGPLLAPGAGPRDNATLEHRSDVIHFDTPLFGSHASYAGEFVVELWVSANVPAPQLFVRLNVVDRDGRSTNLTDRLILAQLAGTAEPTFVRIVMPPTCFRVATGERLRLLIAGGAFPRYARSSGTVEPPGSMTVYQPAAITIHHSAAHSSTLRLPQR